MENENAKTKEKMTMADRFLTAMFSPKEYERLLKEKEGKTVWYLILLILLITMARYIVPSLAVVAGMGGIKGIVMNEIPSFSLENGEFFIEEKVEKKDEMSSIYVLLDTDIEKFEEKDVPRDVIEAVLISKTNMIVYNEYSAYSGATQEIKFSELKENTLNNQILADAAPILYTFLFAVFVLLFLVEFGKYMLFGLLYTLFMSFYTNALTRQVEFGKIYRISIYAQTIGTLVYAITCGFGNSVLMIAGNIFQILTTMSIMRKVLFPIQIKMIRK